MRPVHKIRGVGADIYGAERLELAKLVQTALNGTELVWYLDGGTLLGAHRTGAQIAHDDDFDIATYIPNFRNEDLDALGAKLTASIPSPYAVRIVTSYATKVEIYEPSSPTFQLPDLYGDADFHTVTVDLQIMTDAFDGVIYLHDMLQDVRVPSDAISPTGMIDLEGHTFNCPRDIVSFLEAQYGYIGSDASFDPETKKYVKA